MKQNDPRYYKFIVSSNQKKEAPSTNQPAIASTVDGSISHGSFGTKINRKSLNRGRVAPGHHGSPSRIQETPLPPTPGSSQSSSNQFSSTAVPVSILDHNPLARIHSVTNGQSINPSPTPGLIPKRSTSLRSSILPLVEDRKQSSGCIDNRTVGEASTSNYFISFNPSHDGKVSSGSFPSTSSASSSGTSSVPFNPGMSVTGNSNHDKSNGTSSATSSASSIQRGDTFSKRKKGRSSLLQSMSEDSTEASSSSSHGQDQTGNSSSNLTCNNGYLPLNEDSDESGQVITTTCTSPHSKDNQRIPAGSPATDDDGNSVQSHQESEEQKRGKRIGTKLVHLSSQNVAPSSDGASFATSVGASSSIGASFATSVGASSSSSSGVEKEGIGRVNDTNHHQRNCSSFSSHGRLDSQVIVNDGRSEADDECHAMYATSGYHDEEDMIANIYEETEDLILDDVTDDNDQFSPPPSYAEVIQDSAGINFTPAINYDSRNFPTFINPISTSKQQQKLDHNSIVIVMDSKVSSQNPRQPSNNNPATEPGAIHSTGTL